MCVLWPVSTSEHFAAFCWVPIASFSWLLASDRPDRFIDTTALRPGIKRPIAIAVEHAPVLKQSLVSDSVNLTGARPPILDA